LYDKRLSLVYFEINQPLKPLLFKLPVILSHRRRILSRIVPLRGKILRAKALRMTKMEYPRQKDNYGVPKMKCHSASPASF